MQKGYIHAVPEKTKAIQDAPNPTDVSWLKSYSGLLSYYQKFIPNLSSVLSPLYNDLLRAELFLSCDASSYGLDVVLSYKMPDGSEFEDPLDLCLVHCHLQKIIFHRLKRKLLL